MNKEEEKTSVEKKNNNNRLVHRSPDQRCHKVKERSLSFVQDNTPSLKKLSCMGKLVQDLG